MSEKKLSINTENILPIIKKWLYADREVFLRELVANAQDAISKRKIAYTSDYLDKISISIDLDQKTLKIQDTGIGMTCDEIEKYIAQIAFSGAEEFAKNYQNGKDQIIGHFGLGFYSSYMVAHKVEIYSLSFKEGAKGAYWSCDGGIDYTIKDADVAEKGTTIILHMQEDALEFLDKNRITTLLKTYCQFFPVSIDVDGIAFETKQPLWLQNPQNCTKDDYLDFYKTLYPFEPEPLFWVHINIDYPYHVKGILYFPKINKTYDFQKSHINLYSNRVFVSSDCKDLLPDYLTVLKGCIDSPDIPLNVSRSYLQMDKNVRSLSNHISKKVTSCLQDRFTQDRKEFEKNYEDIEIVIKLGMLQDPKLFERVEPFYLMKTTEGAFHTLSEAKAAEEKPTFYYVQHEHQHKTLLELFKKKQIPVYVFGTSLDSACLSMLEEKVSIKFTRLDGQIPEEILENSDEQIDHLKPLFEGLELKLKRFESKTLPGMFVIDESTRRFKEYMQLSGQKDFPMMPLEKELILNTNNPIVQKLLDSASEEKAPKLASWLKNLIALSQNLLAPEELSGFVESSALVFEELSLKTTETV